MPTPPATPLSQPGIFNVLDPWYDDPIVGWTGMVANDSSVGERNAAVLQAIIDYAQTTDCTTAHAYGAIILFPGHAQVPVQDTTGHDAGAEYFLAVADTVTEAPFFAVQVSCNWPLRFLGTGSVRLTMVPNDNSDLGDIFFVQSNTGKDADIGGVTFEDLELKYGAGSTDLIAAVHVAVGIMTTPPYPNNGGQNVRLIRVVFVDCPIGVWFEKALQPSMLHCTGVWSSNVGVAVVLGGPYDSSLDMKQPAAIEAEIAFCTFRANLTGCTAMQVISAEHLRVENVRMEGFSNGIQIVPPANGYNVVRCHFSNVSCYVGLTDAGIIGTALLIETSPSEDNESLISQLVFTACEFEPGDSRTSSDQPSGPGIFINQASGTVIDTVRFVSCYSCRFPGPGMLINGGRHIEVLGGMYSGNNLGGDAGTPSTQPYGIYATNVTGLRIVGANCKGQYEFIDLFDGSLTASPKQVVGIYIDAGATNVIIDACTADRNTTAGISVNGGAADVIIDSCDVTQYSGESSNGIVVSASEDAVTNVFIRNCNATGFSAYDVAITVTGSGSNVSTVQVTNCAGYNDQGVPVATAMPISASDFYNYDYGYYGPVEFYTTPQEGVISTIAIDSHVTSLTQGSFFLQPGEYGAITWHGVGIVPPSFLMIGK